MWHMLQGAVIHYLRDCEDCDAPADSDECRRVNEYVKKKREENFNSLLTYAQMCSMHLHDDIMKLNLHNPMRDVKCVAIGSGTIDTGRAYGRQFVLEARIKFMLGGRAGADDAVDMFEGRGPGCMGAAVQTGTSGAPATWTDCEVAMAKYCEGTGTLEHEPVWKEEFDARGLDPHEIK
eukprot:jgi/Tetstr1/454518/TSEL_041416.t2